MRNRNKNAIMKRFYKQGYELGISGDEFISLYSPIKDFTHCYKKGFEQGREALDQIAKTNVAAKSDELLSEQIHKVLDEVHNIYNEYNKDENLAYKLREVMGRLVDINLEPKQGL